MIRLPGNPYNITSPLQFTAPISNLTYSKCLPLFSFKKSMSKIELYRVSGDFGFEATDENNHTVRMDSSPDSGGQNFGVRPMQMLLMGLGGCSAIDVISILKKQSQDVQDYRMV